jgi:thioredoxin-related protein
MKNILASVLCFSVLSFTIWQPDFETAQKIAKEKKQLILLNFSGSDWCIPCIRMRRTIFESEEFLKMADTTLVLVNADFPRNKKNQLKKESKEENEKLAEKYNPDGKFPFTLLLEAKGKIIRVWDGLPSQTPQQFTNTIKTICDANKH